MATVLVVYATTEGQTAKVAAHIADVARRLGHEAEVVTAEQLTGPEPASLEPADVIFVGGSMHEGRHQKALVEFVGHHLGDLERARTGFFSLSLSAAGSDEESQQDARRCIDDFLSETHWQPTFSEPVAGALRYTQYSFFKRYVMRMIAKQHGGETDVSKDYEYTDWNRVTAFAERVLADRSAT